MKKFWMIIMSLLTVSYIFAQQCDIVCEMKGVTATDIRVGQHTDVRFAVFNNAKGSSCEYAAKSVQVVLSLPSNGLKFEVITSPVEGKGDYFTWTYNKDVNSINVIQAKAKEWVEANKPVSKLDVILSNGQGNE
jgi:hypothetical protein